jgi:S-DNA-T family DNA segregation ATPase FtsK/SpoIIIE
MAEAAKGSTLVATLPVEPEPVPQPAPSAPEPVRTVSPEDLSVGNPDDEAEAEGLGGVLPPAKAPKLKVDPDPKPQVTGKVAVTKPERIERATAAQLRKPAGDYVYPGLDLITKAPAEAATSKEDYRRRAGELIQTLREFRVEVVPVDPDNGVDVGIQQGPSITRYEIKPAPGVRVERIAGLQNNIAMNLKAEAVRILAPVPGKGTVGIEIPNSKRQLVALREILESKAWVEAEAAIPVVLGVDSVTNKPVVQDLARMPHALIAGSTGSGKSVCINTLLISMLYRMSPADLRLIMVDPKVVELQVYNEIPHLLVPVVTDPQKVPAALKWLITEMERRYQVFAAVNVRNLAGFNARISRDAEEAAKAKQEELNLTPEERAAAAEAAAEVPAGGIEIPKEKMPFIVCIIDEMADLMMVAAKDIETSVARIAQKARAAGIHMVLATQRPSTDVITGLIKANLPTRIGFKVAANVDSRTILDRSGAETLVGFGDMLFLPPGSASLQRVQGSFISDEDVSRIVAFIREKNGPPEFLEEIKQALERANQPDDGEGDGEGGGPTSDPMAAKAWEIIRTTRRASVSMLQRRLAIGYNRAARIMDILEQEGYVGPDNGSSPREILRED